MTQAMTWAVLREFWLEYGSIVPSKVQDNIKELLEFFKPNYVDDTNLGDSGYVYFIDGSTILYDWDEGHFECEGRRLQYPYDKDDPLFWKSDS